MNIRETTSNLIHWSAMFDSYPNERWKSVVPGVGLGDLEKNRDGIGIYHVYMSGYTYTIYLYYYYYIYIYIYTCLYIYIYIYMYTYIYIHIHMYFLV